VECLNCGRDIDESLFASGLSYCPYCGQDLTSSRKGADTDRLSFCPYCGRELVAKTNFCPHCGRELLAPGTAPSAKHEAREFIGHTTKAIKSTFGLERRSKKLYKQWAEHADLPSEEIPSLIETTREVPARESRERMKEQNLRFLYILLAVSLLILVIGLTFLIWTLVS